MTIPRFDVQPVRRVFVTLAAMGLALSACSGDDDTAAGVTTLPTTDATVETSTTSTIAPSVPASTDATPTSDATTVPPTAPATDAPTTVAESTVPSSTSPTATTTPNTADCLIGEWTVSDADLEAYFDVVRDNGFWESIEHDGTIGFDFTGDTYTRTLDLTLTMGHDGVVYVGMHDSTATQAYAPAEGRLEAAGGLTFEGDSEFTRNGEPLVEDPGDLFVGVLPLADVDAFTYSCDGPTLTVGAGPSLDDTYELTLTPT